MAVKTFTNEQLTASDTNTYLANAGLVYVTSATVGTAVSSVTVNNCFSSTYDNYRIIVSGGTASTNIDLWLTLGSSATGYYGGALYFGYASGSGTPGAIAQNNATQWNYTVNVGTTNTSGIVDLIAPYLAKPTGMMANYSVMNTAGSVVISNGFHNVATSYTGFTLTCSGGNITGQLITVFGYRKA